MRNIVMLLGVVLLASFSSKADGVRIAGYKFNTVKIWPDSPGCTMSITDEETVVYVDNDGNIKPGFTGHHPTSGNTCTIYRNGVVIGTCLTNGGETFFTDYDVVPGETYAYEIRASRDRYVAKASFNETCNFIYKVEIEPNEISFSAAGGVRDKRRLLVSVYKQYSDSLVAQRFNGVGVTVYRKIADDWLGISYDWSNYPNSHTIDFWTTPNESGSVREGVVTIDISYTGHSYPVRIVQAAKEVTYSSWAAANGLSGAWDEKDANGICNVFRYVFNKPAGDFSETPLIGISFVDGKPVIKTPVVVNTTGFTLSVMASDMADGTGNVTNYKLNASGETKIEEAVKPSRFFRLKVDIPQ